MQSLKMNSSNTYKTTLDLLIVGAGPVGLTAALEARRLGLSARIIDRKKKRSSHDSRALVVHPRVMELLEPIQDGAVTEKIENAAFNLEGIKIYLEKWYHMNDDSDDCFDCLNANVKRTIWGDTNYPSLYFLPQYETERILEETLNACGGQVDYGVSLENLSQEGNLVTSILRNSNGDTTEIVTSTWVLGADGGRSKTRDLVGIKMNRLQSDLYFVVADLVLKGDLPLEDQLSGRGGHIFPTGKGLIALLPLPTRNSYRFVGKAPVGVTSADQIELNATFFEELLFDRTGRKFHVELGKWQNIFHVTHGASDSYRNRNVMLAGDASHVHSPIGGQGMNLGIQDANNLLWKLAWAKRFLDAVSNEEEEDETTSTVDTILESYHSERHALGQNVIRSVEMATKLMNAKSRFVQFLRGVLMRIGLRSTRANHNFRKVGQLETAYAPSSSSIIFDGNMKKPCIVSPGQRVPNIRLEDGSNLHSHIDRVQHTWVFLNPHESLSSRSPNVIGTKVVFLVPAKSEEQVSVPKITEKALTAQQILLVRPDQFVAGVGRTQEEMLNQLRKVGINEKAIAVM